ncbi:MAG: hypothetical protein V1915_02865 [Candidatus Bathyarchaeota archaeon]
MDKVKWSLRTITVCCAILPLLFTVLAYQGNLIGLLVPPQIKDVMSGNNQSMQEILPDLSNMSNLIPTFNNDFHFNSTEGTFGFSVNLKSPLKTPITFNSFSLTVTDENGTSLGTINLGNALTLVPGMSSTLPIEGTVSPELVTLLQGYGINLTDPDFTPENLEQIGQDLTNITFTNVNIDVGGISIHLDQLDPNELFGGL